MDNDFESRYENGKLPAWAYYQLNGKSAQENYTAQKRARRKKKDQKPLDNTMILLDSLAAAFAKTFYEAIRDEFKKSK